MAITHHCTVLYITLINNVQYHHNKRLMFKCERLSTCSIHSMAKCNKQWTSRTSAEIFKWDGCNFFLTMNTA